MCPLNHNLDGANFFAPSLSNIKAVRFRQPNITDAIGFPLLIIGIGLFGESVTNEFKTFTKYHRSGFSWSSEKLARFSFVQGSDVYEEIGDLTRISIDRFADVAWNMRQFLQTSPLSRCVLIADLSDKAVFKLVEHTLGLMYSWDGQATMTPPDLLLSVDKNNNLGAQSARVRLISIWQDLGRHLEDDQNEAQMVSRAFFVSQESSEKNTIMKMVLSLFSLYHADQPLALELPNRKNVAVNFKAIHVPFKELIKLQSVELTRKLFLGDNNYFKLEPISDGTLKNLARDPDVLEKWKQISHKPDLDAPRQLLQYLNDRNLAKKWHKLYLLSGWLINKGYNQFSRLNSFVENSNNQSLKLAEIAEQEKSKLFDELKKDAIDPFLRWSSKNPERDSQLFLSVFFPDQQLVEIQARIGSRCGFVMRQSDLQPFIYYIPLRFEGADLSDDHLYLSDEASIEQLFFDCYSDIKYLLEEKFIQNQANINAKFLTIDQDTSGFLMDVPELIPGRINDSWALISHKTLDMSQASKQLTAAYSKNCRIPEPGLAMLISIEPDVHFSNFPSSKGYLSGDTDDKRLKNAVDLEKNLFGKDLYELSPTILRYLSNIRTVSVFFEAFRKGLITFNVNKGWQIKFLEEAYYEKNVKPPYPKTIESLVYVFKEFCLDGHSKSMLSPDIFEGLLRQLKTEMMSLEPIHKIDQWFEEGSHNAKGESADICFLYKKINRI